MFPSSDSAKVTVIQEGAKPIVLRGTKAWRIFQALQNRSLAAEKAKEVDVVAAA